MRLRLNLGRLGSIHLAFAAFAITCSPVDVKTCVKAR